MSEALPPEEGKEPEEGGDSSFDANDIDDLALPEEAKQILEAVPAPQRKAVKALIAVSITRFRGPLPHPDTMRAYDEIVKGSADRIITIFEEQSRHRMRMEEVRENAMHRQFNKAQNSGLIVALSFLAVAGTLVGLGHEISGTILGSIDLVGLVALFVLRRPPSKGAD